MNTHPKSGRPKVRASKLRSCAIRAAVTPAIYSEIVKEADERGVSMAAVVRERLERR